MGTGESLTASERVQRLQTALHAKAKEVPGFRFYSLSDKVWRDDVLTVAWQAVRRNGGAAGVDGETVADIEARGVDRWLGALARDLKEGTYRPRAVRQVLIPKKQRGKFRPLGIPCLREARVDRWEHWAGPEGGDLPAAWCAIAEFRPSIPCRDRVQTGCSMRIGRVEMRMTRSGACIGC